MAKEPMLTPSPQQPARPQPVSFNKLLEEMRNAPAGNWTIRNIETLCGQLGLEFKAPRRAATTRCLASITGRYGAR